jgi:glycosyltransferase involved in cell wall biosynthesis
MSALHNMNDKPHVVMLNKSFPPWIGGIERHVRDIGKALVCRGWRVTALVCNEEYNETQEQIDGVNVIRAPQWARIFSQPFVSGYYRRMRELKPDLVHVHVPFPLGWRVVRHIGGDVPLLCTWHSDIIRQRWLMPFLSPFQKRFLERCNRIIPTSQPLMVHSPALQSFRDKCTVIPLALPTPDFVDEAAIQEAMQNYRRRFPIQIVLFVGRLVPYKGLPYLLEAMKNVNAALLIAGEGSQKESLQHQTRRLGLESKVHFLGAVSENEKIALYRVADLFALPSIETNEAFGYVLLEAMEQGCPIVSTDLPTGVRIVNQQEESGLIVPPRNAESLSCAIQRILHDSDFRAHLARGAQNRARDMFNFETAVDNLERVYCDSLASPGSNISAPAR